MQHISFRETPGYLLISVAYSQCVQHAMLSFLIFAHPSTPARLDEPPTRALYNKYMLAPRQTTADDGPPLLGS